MSDPSDVQARITTFWSGVAAGYEAHAGNVAEYGSTEYDSWVDALAPVLPDPPADVLDVAAGTGYLALAAAALGHRVAAVDLSPAMLDELAASATARGLAVDARVGDAVAPDFAPASFDAVTSRHLLWTLREPARAMANWRRLLRPGGRLVAVDGFWFTDWEDGEVPALFAEHYTAGTRDQLPLMHLDTPEPILGMLAAAGFIELAAEPRPDLNLGGGVPYLITGFVPRPGEHHGHRRRGDLMSGPEVDLEDILVTIGHNFGDIEVPLTEWIRRGPGPRKHLPLLAARSRSTGERLPLEVIPLVYRNTDESRRLIAEGKLDNPWPDS